MFLNVMLTARIVLNKVNLSPFCKFLKYNFCTYTVRENDIRQKCCRTLGLPETYTATELKESFLRLAKQYHPDAESSTSDAAKFTEVESAYRTLKNLDSSESEDLEEEYQTLEKYFGIKHTVPQHRQYLSYGGVGYGTQSQRQRQYQNVRVTQALQNVYEHKIKEANPVTEKQLVFKDAALAREFKTRQAMERLVEDLIQASMARGEFDNLPGSGKPLVVQPENPYVDSTTQKLNQILINNGFTPEWIVLQREIHEDAELLRTELRKQRAHLGPVPVNDYKAAVWMKTLTSLTEEILKLNIKIDKFNMIVPILKRQKLRFNLEKEAKKALNEIPELEVQDKIKSQEESNSEPSFSTSMFFKFIK